MAAGFVIAAQGADYPILFEAESGQLGADWALSNSLSPAFITISSNSTGDNPGTSARVGSYSVDFPAAGTYQLYARFRVSSGAYNDDSLFYGASFGTRNPALNTDWVLVNGLAGAGFVNGTDSVTGGGSAGTGVWKWINLSQFTGREGFSVSSANTKLVFEIGGREDGLEVDKLAFGASGVTFTVAQLDGGLPGGALATVDLSRRYQVIEGFGGAIAFYNGWVTAHPYKQEIFTNAFAGLNLSMLRLGNWFRYQSTANFDSASFEIVTNANRILGRQVPILMSSWAPPAFLKSNGEVGNGGTLLYTNGGFAYKAFADYWYDSLVAYRAKGVWPKWISIQNEPDWEASYDSCIFRATEGMYNGTNWAGYSNALSATYLRLTNLPSPPLMLGPEPVGIGYNVPQNYAANMNPNHFYGFNYHLYHGSSDGSANGYINAFRATTNLFPTKPKFMTEFGVSNMVESATLIHNALTEGLISGYNHWSLIWPGTDGGLIQIEFPWNQAQWTNAPPGTATQSKGYWLTPSYWAMKHFSYFITPGSRRIGISATDAAVKASAYLTEDGLRLVAVFINRSATTASTMSLNVSPFVFVNSGVYQTVDTNKFQALGALGPELSLPPQSLTTVVLDKYVALGAAGEPLPANGTRDVPFDSMLSWAPGSNAVSHAIYLGINSNAVAQATPGAPEFKGAVTNNTFETGMVGGTTYYWRVDAIAGGNTNFGAVWSFTTHPLPALVHRYSFNETNGATITEDSEGGAAWNGSLPRGGFFSSGSLSLSSNAQQYVLLPSGIVNSFSQCSIECWLRLASTAAWTRIFDFGSSTANYMFLTPMAGSNGRLRFAIMAGGGGEQQLTAPSALGVNSWNHVVVTINGSTGYLYLNGTRVATNASMTLTPLSLGNTPNNFIGRSQFVADPYLNGAINEFRIYSVALSPQEVAATYSMGSDQLLNAASPALNAVGTPGGVRLEWPVASAGYVVQACTNLATGDWVTQAQLVPQLINGKWQVSVPAGTNQDFRFYRLSR